jgi:hypothetical protein
VQIARVHAELPHRLLRRLVGHRHAVHLPHPGASLPTCSCWPWPPSCSCSSPCPAPSSVAGCGASYGYVVFAHSLRRDASGLGACPKTPWPNRSPMSMTSPKTNLTRGHCAPVSVRPWPAPHPTFCHNTATSFIGTIRTRLPALRPNPSLERRPHEACHLGAAQGSRRLHCPARRQGGTPRGSPQLERWAAGRAPRSTQSQRLALRKRPHSTGISPLNRGGAQRVCSPRSQRPSAATSVAFG